MKDKFLNYSISKIKSKNNFDDIKIAELRYGLEAFYMLFTKMVVIILINLVLGLTKELILFLIFFTPLRGFGFGFHAKTNFQCWLISLPLFIIIPYLIHYMDMNFITTIIITIFALISFLLFGPADTLKKPLINYKKRLINKFILVCVCLLYLFLINFIQNDLIVNSITFACLWQSICVNPLMYKLFNQPFNNYKVYLNEV